MDATQKITPPDSHKADEEAVRALYQDLLLAWNERNAAKMADLFSPDGNVTGFDGSQMNGQAEIAAEVGRVFAGHQTGAYVSIVREVRLLAPGVALLRAVTGVVPAGKTDIDPAVNAIQSLVAVKIQGLWEIELYQNTPAQFHGRPDLAQSLTAELRAALKGKRPRKKHDRAP
jgi:uncharacterized protein (TIGR02246 family)